MGSHLQHQSCDRCCRFDCRHGDGGRRFDLPGADIMSIPKDEKRMRSYREQVREDLETYGKAGLPDDHLTWFSTAELIIVLAIIADELHDLNQKQRVLYLCDGEKCESCSSECHYTTDLQHAANFNLQDGVFIEGRAKWRDSTRET